MKSNYKETLATLKQLKNKKLAMQLGSDGKWFITNSTASFYGMQAYTTIKSM